MAIDLAFLGTWVGSATSATTSVPVLRNERRTPSWRRRGVLQTQARLPRSSFFVPKWLHYQVRDDIEWIALPPRRLVDFAFLIRHETRAPESVLGSGAAEDGVVSDWAGCDGPGQRNGGGGDKNKNNDDDAFGPPPESQKPRGLLLWLGLLLQALHARSAYYTLAHAATTTAEETDEICAEHPSDQKRGPLHQVVVRGPVDRLLIPRDRLERAVESMLAANRDGDAPIDHTAIRHAIDGLNAFYGEHGYALALVRRAPDTPIRDGVLVLEAYEPLVARILVQYVDANHEPCQGRTRAYVIARALGYDGLAEDASLLDKKALGHRYRRQRHLHRGRKCPRKRPFRWTEQHFRRLQQLGLFESISVDARVIDSAATKVASATADSEKSEPSDSSCEEAGDVELTITVRERHFHRFEPGITLSRGKLYGDLTWEDANVDGRGIRFHADIRTKPDRSDDSISLGLQNPRLGSKAGGYQVRLFESKNPLLGSRRGAELVLMAPQPWSSSTTNGSSRGFLRPATWRALLQHFQQQWNIQTGMLYEQVRASNAEVRLNSARTGALSQTPLLSQQVASSRQQAPLEHSFTHLVLNSSAIRDTRPDPFHPQGGYRIALHSAYAVPITTKNPEYSRFGVTGSLYKSIPPLRGLLRRASKHTEKRIEQDAPKADADETPRRACLALLAEARISSVSLPDSERYAFGGSATVRGMRDGHLGQVGSFARTCAEVRYPLDKRLMLVAFTDWGTEIGPIQHLNPFRWLQRSSRGRRLGTEVVAPPTRSGVSAAERGTSGGMHLSREPVSAASVGLGLRILGTLRMECGWLLDRGAGARVSDWRLSRDSYWHIGIVDVSF
ncbi:hypothetical protein CCYA_CCYA02G0719 [Cyanidiococcus yangmingshanensis]|nr:hypothetical protein CCYA_CCYA02G0719 [Cyanidiococcus yangmingshanensis]